jgi:hypothetical protein
VKNLLLLGTDIANEVRATISKTELAREAGKEGGRGNIKALADSTKPFKPPNTRKAVAIEAKLVLPLLAHGHS